MTATHRNRLADATSPYLQQHAHNPVDWWPWCEEALGLARSQDKPILLSVGYSACHWCHVMAHESFEDEETAALMNRLFVNIKVDREERPDLDKIYQSAHQLLARRPGGWPLTMFLTPDDRVPFFGGTYFPKEPRHGLPAFRDLLERIEAAYREQQREIREQNRSMLEALAALAPDATAHGGAMSPRPVERAVRQLAESFDPEHGGFGGAPKFPHPTNLALLLRHWARGAGHGEGREEALRLAVFTLERMIRGGINDQLGGGFCRYSVDERWMIPHFEKMLYDNGPLLSLCCDAWEATGREELRQAAEATAEWAIREMQGPEGGYYSSLDADSEGEEGRFYVWDRREVEQALTPEEYRVVAARYGLDGPPNFEGRWHLHGHLDAGEVSRTLGSDREEVERLLAGARVKLLEARQRRLRPGRDEKVLTSWNALMIQGMARAARVLGRPDYRASAERALGFLRRVLWRNGRLLATCKDGRAHLGAYLDDYAYLLDAVLELLQTRWRGDDLALAVALADTLLARFEDPAGGFFFTADDHEELIQRPKTLADDSTPAGNGVAARVLLRLGHLLGEARYLDAAERTLRAAWRHLDQLPYAHGALLEALDEWLEPTETLVARAPERDLPRWREAVPRGLAPWRLALFIPDDAEGLPGALAERATRPGGVAYLCTGTRCGAPITSPSELARTLAARRAA
jgi:uncharacterized protein YyaL (SSP411 family)